MRRLWLVMIAILVSRAGVARAEDSMMLVYVGNTGGEKAKGIVVMRMDVATGKLSDPQLAGDAKRPSFVAIHPSGKFLYATDESAGMGAVSGFAIDRGSGKLSAINSQSSGGKGACFVAIDHAGKNALVANYGSGSVSVVPIDADGKLGSPSAFVQHEGSSVDPKRQGGPHGHSINVDPADRFALACDLGLDKVLIYRLDQSSGKLEANDPPFAQVAPGAGPRHLAFGKSGKFAYVINEMGNTVTAFSFDASKGAMSEVQTISTLPDHFKETSYCAEIMVHPSGKFLYGSNRGHDSIAIFAIDEASGKLESRGTASTGGKWPRNFGIDPSGKWLLAANEHSDSIVVFEIDQTSGALTPNGSTANVVSPSCVRFLNQD